RLLDLEEIHLAKHAAVYAKPAVLCHKIIDRHLPHFRHYLVRVLGAERLDGFEIVVKGAVHAGLWKSGWPPDALLEALRESTGLLVHVPVEGRGELEALCRFETEAVHI